MSPFPSQPGGRAGDDQGDRDESVTASGKKIGAGRHGAESHRDGTQSPQGQGLLLSVPWSCCSARGQGTLSWLFLNPPWQLHEPGPGAGGGGGVWGTCGICNGLVRAESGHRRGWQGAQAGRYPEGVEAKQSGAVSSPALVSAVFPTRPGQPGTGPQAGVHA